MQVLCVTILSLCYREVVYVVISNPACIIRNRMVFDVKEHSNQEKAK